MCRGGERKQCERRGRIDTFMLGFVFTESGKSVRAVE